MTRDELITGLQDMHDRMRDGFDSAEPPQALLREAIAAIAQDRASRGGDAADGVWVPREPTEAMKRAGGHVNSEWLNDNAPIGEARYAMPMGGVWQAMLAAVPSVATGEQSDLGSLDQLP